MLTGTVTANREAVYAFKGGGFGGEVGVVCSERLRAGYTSECSFADALYVFKGERPARRLVGEVSEVINLMT